VCEALVWGYFEQSESQTAASGDLQVLLLQPQLYHTGGRGRAEEQDSSAPVGSRQEGSGSNM